MLIALREVREQDAADRRKSRRLSYDVASTDTNPCYITHLINPFLSPMHSPRLHRALRAAAILLSSCSLIFGQEADNQPSEREPRPQKEGVQGFENKKNRTEPKEQRKQAEDNFAGMKKKIEALQHEGRVDEAERMRRELAVALSSPSGTKPDKRHYLKHAEGPERLRHVDEAIRHLRQAGLNELASHLESVAKQMRSELSETRRASVKGSEKPRREKGEGDQGGRGDDTRGQLEKLARQLEELRAQVSKLQSGGEGNRQ
jgi:hypothetical protein